MCPGMCLLRFSVFVDFIFDEASFVGALSWEYERFLQPMLFRDPTLSCKYHGSPGAGGGREPPGTQGALGWPGVGPGSGLTSSGPGPGSTLTAPGGAALTSFVGDWCLNYALTSIHP